MAFNYPAKPWKDGQEIKATVGGKELVIAKYDSSKNLWTHLHYNDDGEFFYTTACKVIVDFDECPCEDLNADSLWKDTENVQNALDWLHFQLMRLFDIVEKLEERVKQNEIDIQDLYKLLAAIEGLGDLSEILDRLTALEAQLPVYADEVIQGTRPPKRGDPAIRQGPIFDAIDEYRDRQPDYIVPNTQQETNHLLYDLGVRPPILSVDPPTRHPLHPEEPLLEGDFWIDSFDEIYYWNGTEWVQTRDAIEDFDRPPIISDTEPTEHPKFPGEPLREGDFWIDNHDKRAATTIYYWTGSEWEQIDDHENWDELLKEHTCVQFYQNVGFQKYEQVRNQEGHKLAYSLLNNATTMKFWLSPIHPGFYVKGEYYYVNDAGPYEAGEVTESAQWTTILLEGCPNPAAGIVKVSKIPKLCDTSYNDGRYVLKAGDTMTGNLLMKDANIDFVSTGESLKDGNGDPILEDDGQGNMVEQWDDNNDRFGHIESLPPRLLRSDGTAGADTSEPFGIRVEIDDGNTYKNQFKVGNRNGDAVTITGGGGPQVIFGDFTRNDTAAHGIDNGVVIKGIPTPNRELTPGDYAVNKEYVDKEDLALLNGLIDLQEEIEAIAPSLEKGAWEWDPNTNIAQEPAQGKYFLLQGTYPTWTITDEYILADAVAFNIQDAGGNNHENWDTILGDPNDPDDDKLILLFDKPDPDKCLGKIHNIRDIGESNNPFGNAAIVEFNRIESFGQPNNAQDDDGKYITYVNIFQEPSGGDASSFLLKYGDTIGDAVAPINYEWNKQLKLESLEGIRLNTGSSPAIVSSTKGPNFTTAIFYVEGDRDNLARTKFRVRADGRVQAGHDAATAFIATQDHDVATKKFVDDMFDFDNYQELS